jgi:hypothetical protein
MLKHSAIRMHDSRRDLCTLPPPKKIPRIMYVMACSSLIKPMHYDHDSRGMDGSMDEQMIYIHRWCLSSFPRSINQGPPTASSPPSPSHSVLTQHPRTPHHTTPHPPHHTTQHSHSKRTPTQGKTATHRPDLHPHPHPHSHSPLSHSQLHPHRRSYYLQDDHPRKGQDLPQSP